MKTLSELRRAAEAVPRSAASVAALGRALIVRREYPEGIECLRDAIRLAGNVISYQHHLGRILDELGEPENAAECLESARSLQQDSEEVLSALGWVYSASLKRADAARSIFLHLLGVRRSADALVGLCRTFVAEGGSLRHLLQSAAATLQSEVDRLELHHPMARALMQYGRYEEAEVCLADLLNERPATPEAWLDRAGIARAMRDFRQADLYHQQALTHAPHHVEAIWKYLAFLFATGACERAQAIYRTAQIQRALHGPGPSSRWSGTSVDGRTVLLTRLGAGNGDMIHLARFAGLFADRGANVLVECTRPVQALVGTSPHIRSAILPHDDGVEYDVYCEFEPAIMLLDWDWTALARQVPYLEPSRERVEYWKTIVPRGRDFHVGIVWRAGGSAAWQTDGYTSKSVPPELLRPLMDIPRVVFHNLYVGRPGERELADIVPRLPLRPLSDAFRQDFADVAAAMLALDLVITVDTAAAHVAGALAKDALVLLPYAPCWRWMTSGEECGWYPHCRLIRQPKPGDWASVVATVSREVRKRAAAARQRRASVGESAGDHPIAVRGVAAALDPRPM